MTIIKHNPKVINSLFDEFFNNFPATWGTDFQNELPGVPVNIHETPDAYHLELNAPGRNKEDFKINVDGGMLTISFEQKEEKEQKDYKTIRREFHYQSFKRNFSLDDKINPEGIEAKYENGVLKLLIPKKQEVKIVPKQIAIK